MHGPQQQQRQRPRLMAEAARHAQQLQATLSPPVRAVAVVAAFPLLPQPLAEALAVTSRRMLTPPRWPVARLLHDPAWAWVRGTMLL